MSEVVKISCWRVSGYENISSADLATLITTKTAAVTRISITQAVGRAVVAGGVLAEYGLIYSVMASEWITALKANLAEGNYVGTELLLNIAKNTPALGWSQASKDALDTALATIALSMVDVVAAELAQAVPETIDAAAVDAALGRA